VAGLPQLQVDHPGAVASMPMRQLHDPFTQRDIAIHSRLVAK
jgi:hypothetical protein